MADFGIPQISTGDILREAVRKGTPLGLQAGPIMNAGQLVPDALMLGIISERLKEPDCVPGFVLDGFPRTIPQADGLGVQLVAAGRTIDVVLSLEVPEALIVERVGGRRSCPSCGAVFHMVNNPPSVENICDACGTVGLIIRPDDMKVLKRLETYERETAPLKQYYADKGLLKAIDGTQTPDEVYSAVRAAIGR